MAGTAVMTLMMRKVAPKVVPQQMRPDEFVPKKAIEWAEEQVGRPDALSESQAMTAAMVAHFAYGSGNGAVYGFLRSRLDDVPAPVAGAIFGVALWAVSFEVDARSGSHAGADGPVAKEGPDAPRCAHRLRCHNGTDVRRAGPRRRVKMWRRHFATRPRVDAGAWAS